MGSEFLKRRRRRLGGDHAAATQSGHETSGADTHVVSDGERTAATSDIWNLSGLSRNAQTSYNNLKVMPKFWQGQDLKSGRIKKKPLTDVIHRYFHDRLGNGPQQEIPDEKEILDALESIWT